MIRFLELKLYRVGIREKSLESFIYKGSRLFLCGIATILQPIHIVSYWLYVEFL